MDPNKKSAASFGAAADLSTVFHPDALQLLGVVHVFGSSGCNAASSPFEVVGPEPVFEAAFDGEQGVGSGLRPVAFGPRWPRRCGCRRRWLQSGDDLGDPPGDQLRLDPVHPQLLFAFVRRQHLPDGRRGQPEAARGRFPRAYSCLRLDLNARNARFRGSGAMGRPDSPHARRIRLTPPGGPPTGRCPG